MSRHTSSVESQRVKAPTLGLWSNCATTLKAGCTQSNLRLVRYLTHSAYVVRNRERSLEGVLCLANEFSLIRRKQFLVRDECVDVEDTLCNSVHDVRSAVDR